MFWLLSCYILGLKRNCWTYKSVYYAVVVFHDNVPSLIPASLQPESFSKFCKSAFPAQIPFITFFTMEIKNLSLLNLLDLFWSREVEARTWNREFVISSPALTTKLELFHAVKRDSTSRPLCKYDQLVCLLSVGVFNLERCFSPWSLCAPWRNVVTSRWCLRSKGGLKLVPDPRGELDSVLELLEAASVSRM